MKSPRRILPKPQFKLQNIFQRLLKEPILYTEFLELLTQATDSLYETPELEFELLYQMVYLWNLMVILSI